ncbi:MAG: dihydroneopterin aldolase family protein [Candidatus Thermoplasmatota archaeon]|jgi:hypothetical protein|nr:dihydroneopterin aldolase family protein [Candidatus Thermoplasmatota archaeon]
MYDEFFNCSDRDRAIFEAGIKLGSIFHQYIGNTMKYEDKDKMEKAIKASLLAQPYCEYADVNLILPEKKERDYVSITENMFKISVRINVNGYVINGFLEYMDKYRYPLIYFK